MKAEFLKMAGVSTDKDFYQKYPTEESFFKAYPEAMQMAYGGNLSASNAFHTMPDGTIMPGASHMGNGGMIKRADGSYSKRGLWDNIRANAGSGKAPTKQMLAQEKKIKAMANGGSFNNPGFNALPLNVQNKIKGNTMMHGGAMPYQMGGQLTEFEGGGTHQENPNGGIPQGPTASVEQGETKMDSANYIFSDRLKVPADLAKELQMPYLKGKTFAQASKAINKKYDPQGKRETDRIVQNVVNKDLKKLMAIQEVHKADMIAEHQAEIMDLTGGQATPQDLMQDPSQMQQPTMQDMPMEQPMGGMPEGIDQGMQMGYGGMYRKQMGIGGGYDPAFISGLSTVDSQEAHDELFKSFDINPNASLTDEAVNAWMKNPFVNDDGTFKNKNNNNPFTASTTLADANRVMPAYTGNQATQATQNPTSGIGNMTVADATTLGTQLGVMGSNIRTGKMLKDMKPVPKDIGMFDMDMEIKPNYIDEAPYMADLDAEAGAAKQQTEEISGGSRGTALANIGATADKIGRAKATVRQNIDTANSEIDFKTFSANLAAKNYDMARRMQVQDWNDADLNAFQEALLNFRANKANNAVAIGTSAARMQRGRDLESGKEARLSDFKRKK